MLLREVIALLHSELQKGVEEIERQRRGGVFMSVDGVRVELPFSAALTEAENYMNIDVVPGEGEGRLVVRFVPVKQPAEPEAEVGAAQLQPAPPPEAPVVPPLESPEVLVREAGVAPEEAKVVAERAKLKKLGARSETAEVLASIGLTPERLAKMNTRSVVRSIERAAERGRVPPEYTLNLGEVEALIQRAKAMKRVR